MKKFSIVQPIYMAFYSRELYRDVAISWGGSVFVYLFLLLALCWIPLTGRLKSEYSSYMHYEMPKLIDQIPEVTVKGGQAVVNAEMPYTVIDPVTNKPLMIFDTTGKTTSLTGSDALFLLTRDQLIAKKSKDKTNSVKLSDFGDGKFDKDVVRAWAEKVDEWFFLLVYPLALFVSYILRLLQVLLFAVIGIFYSKLLKAGLGYGALVRISAVAITPAVIINTVHDSAGLNQPGWSFVTFMTAMVFLYFGVSANVTAPKPEQM